MSVHWTGSATDATVTANVELAAGNGRDGVPLSGAVDATYDNRRGAVDIRNLTAQTPGSHIQVQGALGVYPLERPSEIQGDLVTTNLAEFDKTLAVLGVSAEGPNGKKVGVAAIPVRLEGEAEFHGTVSGSLLYPDVKGHLKANNFDTVFESAALPVRLRRCGKPIERAIAESRLKLRLRIAAAVDDRPALGQPGYAGGVFARWDYGPTGHTVARHEHDSFQRRIACASDSRAIIWLLTTSLR